MSVPKNIEELAHKVRTEIYGRDVRESIASSMEATAEVAQQIIDESFDLGELNTEIERKLNELEVQYAPELNNVKSQLADIEKLTQNYNVTVTVGGSNADFTTINEALIYLSKNNVVYNKGGFKAEIKLLSGFVMSEQVFIDGVDLGYITITSEDAEVSISREALVDEFEIANADNDGFAELYPAFAARNNGALPIIDILFNMDYSGIASNRIGFVVADNSSALIKPKKGCINAGGVGLYAINGSHAVAYEGDFEGSGVACFRGSFMSVRRANVSGAYNNIYLGSSSVVEALGANITNAGNRGIWCYANGQINARDADISGCGERAIYANQNASVEAGNADLSDSYIGIYAERGSTVEAHNAVINNCENGAIFTDGLSNVNAEHTEVNSCGGLSAVISQRAATVNLKSANIKGNTGHGMFANRGGSINADDAICENNGETDIRVARGSIISAYNAIGTLSKVGNMHDTDGVIYTSLDNHPMCILQLESNINLEGGVSHAIEWSDISRDYGFFNPLQKTKLTVPKGVKRVRLTSTVDILDGGEDTREVFITMNGFKNYRGASAESKQAIPASATTFNITSMIIPVEEGDFFELMVRHNHASSRAVGAGRTSFTIEAV